MRLKNGFIIGSILVLGVLGAGALAATATNSPGKEINARNHFQWRFQHKFMDQNCDGINDRFRDHDNDGIPNGRDPDWAPPKDGTGYKNGNRRGGVRAAGIANSWNKAAFRGRGTGPGFCDGTGPHGRSVRRGRG